MVNNIRLDSFKIKAIQKSAGKEAKYELHQTLYKRAVETHIVKMPYLGTQIYFEVEIPKNKEITLRKIQNKAKKEMQAIEEMVEDPTTEKQLVYIGLRVNKIYAQQIKNQEEKINDTQKELLQNEIMEVVMANKEDFLKSYNYLISEEAKNKIFKINQN